VGILIHGFDGTELPNRMWVPCTVGWCENAVKWWSSSIITNKHRVTFADAGIIFAPPHTKVLCSHYCDFGSLHSGCDTGVPGNSWKGGPYPANRLKEMMQLSEPMNMYNEVLVDMKYYKQELPKSVGAFFYGTNFGLTWGAVQATHAYVTFLDAWNLTESDVPLIKFNLSNPADTVMTDVSAGARQFLKEHSHSEWRTKWLKNHPFLRDHPEEMPGYLREQAERQARRIGKLQEQEDEGPTEPEPTAAMAAAADAKKRRNAAIERKVAAYRIAAAKAEAEPAS
jgi:hypothetical protein